MCAYATRSINHYHRVENMHRASCWRSEAPSSPHAPNSPNNYMISGHSRCTQSAYVRTAPPPCVWGVCGLYTWRNACAPVQCLCVCVSGDGKKLRTYTVYGHRPPIGLRRSNTAADFQELRLACGRPLYGTSLFVVILFARARLRDRQQCLARVHRVLCANDTLK